jgi:trk system potassium uptake protein
LKSIIQSLSFVGILLGAAFLLSGGVGFLHHDAPRVFLAFFVMGGVCLLASWISWRASPRGLEIRIREAVLLVLSTWILTGIVGALPYLVLEICRDPISALFESVSGITTTGASVLSNLESLPHALIFWRSLTHFIGGVGILVMFIAVLPFVGTGAMQLYRTESTGPISEKITARIADTARIIVGIYLLLNVLCTAALRACGLSWFDAVCHAFGTIATGGFSTRSESIAAFHNPAAEWVIVFFMFISAISFVFHFSALRGDVLGYFRSQEARFFVFLCATSAALVSFHVVQKTGSGVSTGIRNAVFQTVSLFSTTGFTTADYDVWPDAVKFTLLTLMIIGGCAGSTSGAVKSVRFVVAGKLIARRFGNMLHPARVQAVKLDGRVIDNDSAGRAAFYIFLYFFVLCVGSVFVGFFSQDILTAVSAVIACLGGVGPGMSGAGPSETYALFPAAAKMGLIVCMLLGRLEIYVCLVVFTPGFWKT